MIVSIDPEFSTVSKKISEVKFVSDLMELSTREKASVTGLVVRLGTNLSRDLLLSFPELRFVATITTGLDHIDLEYCDSQNIEVLSLKGEQQFLSEIRATPEHTWALLMSLVRNVPEAFQDVKNGSWKRRDHIGSELYGKTIGLIGFGRVAKVVARYAQAFGLRVLVFEKSLVEIGEFRVESVDLEHLLSESHIVSLHLPLEKNTAHFLGRAEFHLMKKKPVFINTSRGAIVEESALLDALESGEVRAAAVDVLEGENDFDGDCASHALVQYSKKHSNLLITPHIAGTTRESMAKTALFIEDKILRFLS